MTGVLASSSPQHRNTTYNTVSRKFEILQCKLAHLSDVFYNVLPIFELDSKPKPMIPSTPVAAVDPVLMDAMPKIWSFTVIPATVMSSVPSTPDAREASA